MGRSRTKWYPLILLLIGVGVYANSLQGGHFILDDEPSIKGNFDIRQILPLWRDADQTSNPAVNNRPVVRLSLALNYAWGELEIRGYRAFNLGVHLLCGVLLYGVARSALRSRLIPDDLRTAAAGLAFAAALLWLVHPLQTQCVNHTIQRSTSLMGLFLLLTLWCVGRGIESGGRGWHAAAVAFCAMGMGSKEAMVVAPVAVLLYDRTFAAGSFRRALALRWQMYLGLAATWGALGLLLRQNPHGKSIDLSQPSIVWHYAMNQTRIIIEHYIAKLVWPLPLTNFYGPIRYTELEAVWPFFGAMCGLVVLVLVALYRWPLAGFCGAWFLLLLAPTSSVAAIFWEAMAERRPYLAIAGLLALLVVGVYRGLLACGERKWLSPRVVNRVGVGAVGAAVVYYSSFTVARNGQYQDLSGLWRGEVAYVQAVVAELDDALPKVRFHHAEAHTRLGRAYASQGRWQEAEASFHRGLAVYPQSAKAHQWLGHLYRDRSKPEQAIHHLRRSVELNPESHNAHNALGALLCMRGAVDEGMVHLRRALDIFPNYVWAYSNLGAALMLQGRDAEAKGMFERALEIAPGFGPARQNLADLGGS